MNILIKLWETIKISYWDKVQHFVVGLVISLLFGLIFNSIIGLMIAIAAGVGKEMYDDIQIEDDFGTLDLAATSLGAMTAFFVLWVF